MSFFGENAMWKPDIMAFNTLMKTIHWYGIQLIQEKNIFKYTLTHYVSYVVVYPFALPIWFLSQSPGYFLELSFGATQLTWSY